MTTAMKLDPAWNVVADPDDEDRRLLLPVKTNLAKTTLVTTKRVIRFEAHGHLLANIMASVAQGQSDVRGHIIIAGGWCKTAFWRRHGGCRST